MTYDDAMTAARERLAARDFDGAYRLFGKAHGLGHDVLAQHVGAHRGMIAAGWHGRNPARVLKQAFLLVAAYLFESRQPAQVSPRR
jgi:hypothetical protein